MSALTSNVVRLERSTTGSERQPASAATAAGLGSTNTKTPNPTRIRCQWVWCMAEVHMCRYYSFVFGVVFDFDNAHFLTLLCPGIIAYGRPQSQQAISAVTVNRAGSGT